MRRNRRKRVPRKQRTFKFRKQTRFKKAKVYRLKPNRITKHRNWDRLKPIPVYNTSNEIVGLHQPNRKIVPKGVIVEERMGLIVYVKNIKMEYKGTYGLKINNMDLVVSVSVGKTKYHVKLVTKSDSGFENILILHYAINVNLGKVVEDMVTKFSVKTIAVGIGCDFLPYTIKFDVSDIEFIPYDNNVFMYTTVFENKIQPMKETIQSIQGGYMSPDAEDINVTLTVYIYGGRFTLITFTQEMYKTIVNDTNITELAIGSFILNVTNQDYLQEKLSDALSMCYKYMPVTTIIRLLKTDDRRYWSKGSIIESVVVNFLESRSDFSANIIRRYDRKLFSINMDTIYKD